MGDWRVGKAWENLYVICVTMQEAMFRWKKPSAFEGQELLKCVGFSAWLE